MRISEVHFESEGVRCTGWHYHLENQGKAPCVILAHGFDGVREQRLDAYAECFAEAGLPALVFDYRGFGHSQGQPRQRVSNTAQLQDWRAAIDYAFEKLPHVDRRRVALWGTSTSGGHVVQLAADDQRIAAVVTQMPFTSGFAQFRHLPILHGGRLVWTGVRDQVNDWLGRKPVTVPAGGQPYTLAVNTTRDALSGLYAITPAETKWRNEVLARFALTTAFYRPGAAAKRLRCPLLVCVADGDRLIPVRPQLKLARHGQLRRYRYGHFEMYFGAGFKQVVADQLAFLECTLATAP